MPARGSTATSVSESCRSRFGDTKTTHIDSRRRANEPAPNPHVRERAPVRERAGGTQRSCQMLFTCGATMRPRRRCTTRVAVRENSTVFAERLMRWKFLLSPWRYDFEYARAWRELDFSIYGLDHNDTVDRRMGGKGRSGNVPSAPWKWLWAGAWTDLDHLGVVESGPTWTVQIDTRTQATRWPRAMLHHAARRAAFPRGSLEFEHSDGKCVDTRKDVRVDGIPVSFEGVSISNVWAGTVVLGTTMLTVVAAGFTPSELCLVQITDPTPYLQKP